MKSDYRLDARKVFINLLLLETLLRKKDFVNFNGLSSWSKNNTTAHIFSSVDFTKSHLVLHDTATKLTIIILSLLHINSLNHRYIISHIFCLETHYYQFWFLRFKEKWYATYSDTFKQIIKYCHMNRITNNYIILLNIFIVYNNELLTLFSAGFFLSRSLRNCVVVVLVFDRSIHH